MTRSYVKSSSTDRFYGFLAASVFTVAYYVGPAYVAFTAMYLCVRGWNPWIFLPMATMLIPTNVAKKFGLYILQSYPFQQIPKYFAFEEFHEFSEQEFFDGIDAGQSYVFGSHPHGIFPFAATCAMISALGAPSDAGPHPPRIRISDDVPTAVATALKLVPVLSFVTGWFGTMDAGAKAISKRIKRRGSLALYVGGIGELFLSNPRKETVILSKRKGFVKLALKHGAKLVPVYYFGNTTCLSALTSGPLVDISRKIGVTLTVFWGRWGLPLPRPTKLVMARGKPIDIPHIPEPTQEDIDKYHKMYCAALLELFDKYKHKNPDYANKTLNII